MEAYLPWLLIIFSSEDSEQQQKAVIWLWRTGSTHIEISPSDVTALPSFLRFGIVELNIANAYCLNDTQPIPDKCLLFVNLLQSVKPALAGSLLFFGAISIEPSHRVSTTIWNFSTMSAIGFCQFAMNRISTTLACSVWKMMKVLANMLSLPFYKHQNSIIALLPCSLWLYATVRQGNYKLTQSEVRS